MTRDICILSSVFVFFVRLYVGIVVYTAIIMDMEELHLKAVGRIIIYSRKAVKYLNKKQIIEKWEREPGMNAGQWKWMVRDERQKKKKREVGMGCIWIVNITPCWWVAL